MAKVLSAVFFFLGNFENLRKNFLFINKKAKIAV